VLDHGIGTVSTPTTVWGGQLLRIDDGGGALAQSGEMTTKLGARLVAVVDMVDPHTLAPLGINRRRRNW